MIPAERWAEAQAAELTFWQSEDRTALCRDLDALYMRELGITADAVRGRSVLDLGGGPLPLAVLMALPVDSLTVVDPLPYAPPRIPAFVLERALAPAEDYRGAVCDEVWGYNVLQHVRDPAAVISTAKAHAVRCVRWFDWTDSPIETHHPHSITADWLVEQFTNAGWRLTVEKRGKVMVPHVQHYVAVVAEPA